MGAVAKVGGIIAGALQAQGNQRGQARGMTATENEDLAGTAQGFGEGADIAVGDGGTQGLEGGNFTDEGTSTWSDCLLTAGIAQTGGGLYTNQHGHTTLHDVAIWSNRARPDDPGTGDDGHGGGGVAVRGGTLVCTASEDFRGPDEELAPVFTANTSDAVPAGAMVVAEAIDLQTFVNFDGCSFGGGDQANTPVTVHLAFRGVQYALEGFGGELVCDLDRCTCDGGDCPTPDDTVTP